MAIKVSPLSDDVAFGARISGVTSAVLGDERVRDQIRTVFEDRGLILFEGVEPSGRMHVDISNVFGQLKDHPVPSVARVDQETMPGVIDMPHYPELGGFVEIEGQTLASWLPWHFDHCYNNELNRAGVLRAITVAPEGGLTLFADGVQLYRSLSPELRARIEGCNILYTLNLAFDDMRFGRPPTLRVLDVRESQKEVIDYAKTLPRAVHPAVWTRADGEKVLHISPWMSAGIEGQEDDAGDALLHAICDEIAEKVQPYAHRWSTNDMLIWDNWRMLHAVSGMDPSYSRRMQRTTIKGDYGLGYFENGGVGDKILEMTV
ncbi:TauD/TfdA dioxygenase family protein [Sphingomonas bacterium]|uniref:TauD/TfdA dioxygenase family protein n=1 Tax=Sphingomonas bacterium TaxID=1895847 RepID=UPI00157555D8|nr:TauD/TfdA family dioxygenase [Sphingomonas bacterium]